MKIRSTLLAIREIQIKTKIRCVAIYLSEQLKSSGNANAGYYEVKLVLQHYRNGVYDGNATLEEFGCLLEI
jgi:hypothetical protein